MSVRAVPRAQRWAPVSGSGNIDTAYRQLWNDAEKAYQYVCWCQPPFPDGENGDDEDEEEDGDSSCDGGKTCLCNKPAQEQPGHEWVTTYACRRKFFAQRDMVHLRSPEDFGLWTYNDHAGYGVVQVVENLLLDFVEADGNWREQWVVCETLAMFLQTDLVEPMMMVDDGEGLDQTMRLVGRTFLAMLARLERERRLARNSEVQNLGLIMAQFVKIARGLRDYSLLEDPAEETVELKGYGGETQTFTFDISRFDDYVLGYAERHGIVLRGSLEAADGAAAECPIPTPEDPWGTGAAFVRYERENGKPDGPNQPPTIGGDSLDITTWSSADRREASHNGRDPLRKSDIAAIVMGLLPRMA